MVDIKHAALADQCASHHHPPAGGGGERLSASSPVQLSPPCSSCFCFHFAAPRCFFSLLFAKNPKRANKNQQKRQRGQKAKHRDVAALRPMVICPRFCSFGHWVSFSTMPADVEVPESHPLTTYGGDSQRTFAGHFDVKANDKGGGGGWCWEEDEADF